MKHSVKNLALLILALGVPHVIHGDNDSVDANQPKKQVAVATFDVREGEIIDQREAERTLARLEGFLKQQLKGKKYKTPQSAERIFKHMLKSEYAPWLGYPLFVIMVSGIFRPKMVSANGEETKANGLIIAELLFWITRRIYSATHRSSLLQNQIEALSELAEKINDAPGDVTELAEALAEVRDIKTAKAAIDWLPFATFAGLALPLAMRD